MIFSYLHRFGFSTWFLDNSRRHSLSKRACNASVFSSFIAKIHRFFPPHRCRMRLTTSLTHVQHWVRSKFPMDENFVMNKIENET